MYNLPKKSKGAVLTAENWNNSVEAIQDALNRSSDFQTMLPSVQASSRWTGGRSVVDKGGFSLRSLVKEGEAWKAYFNPGRVLEVHAGGARVIVPKMGADKMDAVPFPALEAEAGKKVYLDLVWGDNSHDCITAARLSTEETPPGGRSARLTLGEFVSAAQSSGSSADDITYTPFLTGCITYAAASFNEGWRVVVDTDEGGAPAMAYVKKGDIYIAGQLAQRGEGTWEVAPKEEGEIWLEVKCTGDGVIKSAELKETKGSSKPLQYVAEPDDEEAEEEFTYCFLLAKVENLAEPLPEDGNLPSLVSVKQYALGAVYCGVAPDELGLEAGKGIEIVDLDEKRKKEIAALIEDAKEPSSGDCSLIYEEEEDAGEEGEEGGKEGNKGKPYKFKLLCSSDGSVLLKEEDGRIYFSASGKMPEAGDGLEYEKQQNGEGVEEETDILKIKIDSSVDSSVDDGGKWPVNLSVSPAGLKGELDLTVDSQQHEVGGGYKVGLSAEAGALSLIVTPGGEAEELSFRTPLRKNGKYVVLDYESSWSDAVNGVKAGLFLRNNKLAVELYADTEPDGSDNLISDSWTALLCDSNHAIRLHRDENGKIYIQQGEWIVTSKIYSPIN